MAHYMPPAMLSMFAPRPPLEYLEPHVVKRARPLTGLASFKNCFKDPNELAPLVKFETAPEKKARRSKKQTAKAIKRVLSQTKTWNPQENPKSTEDAYKTLFVGRLDYSVTEDDLKKEMLSSGPVKVVRIVNDIKTGKSRGYAFVEFEDEKDLKHAYKAHDGKKIKGRRVCVDVERGRTVPNWKPRRLGGGLGSTRKGDKKKKGAASSAPMRRDDSRSDRPRSSSDAHYSKDSRAADSRSDRDRFRSEDRRDRDRDRFRDRERPADRERGYDRDRSSRGYRDEKSSSNRGRDEIRRDDRRSSSSGLPVNGPPLPPQASIF